MSHFKTPYWPEDYFGQYFRDSGGGAIIGSLSGSFAGSSSFSGTLEDATPASSGHSGVVRLAGSLSAGRLEEMLAWVQSVYGAAAVAPSTDAAQARIAEEAKLTETALVLAIERRAKSVAAAAKAQALIAANDDDEEAIALLLAA
jgi:hypothetical protein